MPDAARAKRVLIVGVSTRAMAESAARAGYDVTALDAFGDLDQHPAVRALSMPRDFGVAFSARAVASVAAELERDAVAYLSPFENHPTAVRRLAARGALWGNDASVLKRARDPQALAGSHERPRFNDTTRWLIKPRASGGGHGIRWWQPGNAVPSSAHVQPFIGGTSGSIVFAAARGNAVPLGLTRQLVGDPDFGADGFRYCGSILGPANDAQFERDANLFEAAVRLASTLTRELGLVGVNCIDFVACDTGDLPVFDLGHARARGCALGKAIVFARHDVICGDTTSWLDDTTVRDVPHPGERIPAGKPVCTVFADGADAAACHVALVARAASVYEVLDSWARVAV